MYFYNFINSTFDRYISYHSYGSDVIFRHHGRRDVKHQFTGIQRGGSTQVVTQINHSLC